MLTPDTPQDREDIEMEDNPTGLQSPSPDSAASKYRTPSPGDLLAALERQLISPRNENNEDMEDSRNEKTPPPSAKALGKRKEEHPPTSMKSVGKREETVQVTPVAQPVEGKSPSRFSLDGGRDGEAWPVPSAPALKRGRPRAIVTPALQKTRRSTATDGADDKLKGPGALAKNPSKRRITVRFSKRAQFSEASDGSIDQGPGLGAPLTRTQPRGSSPHPRTKKRQKRSRLWPAHVCNGVVNRGGHEHGINLGSAHPPKKQAEYPGKFLGDAYRYKFTEPANREAIQGDYTIVYTRPVGKHYDHNSSRCAIFAPESTKRSVKVFTISQPGAAVLDLELEPAGGGQGQFFGVGIFSFSDTPVDFTMYLHPGHASSQTENNARTTFEIRNTDRMQDRPDFNGTECPSYKSCSDFMQIFSKTLCHKGHTIAFGMQELQCWHASGEKIITGFHFMEMEFSCLNPRTGAPDRQLVIAARIPEKDVSSEYLLNQYFTSSYDKEILDQDSHRTTAYEQYFTDYKHFFNDPPALWPRWKPRGQHCVGLGRRDFSPTEFERHFFQVTTDDQIQELERLRSFLYLEMEGRRDTSARSRQNLLPHEHLVIAQAFRYIDNRYENFKGERKMLEEYCEVSDDSESDGYYQDHKGTSSHDVWDIPVDYVESKSAYGVGAYDPMVGTDADLQRILAESREEALEKQRQEEKIQENLRRSSIKSSGQY